MNFGFSEFFLVVSATLLLGFIPRILNKIGFFKVLGKSKYGLRLASLFGSSEPTVFMRGLCVVMFFLVLGFLFLNGITTRALEYEINQPTIKFIQECAERNGIFTAIPETKGNYLYNCVVGNSGGSLGNFSLPFNSSVSLVRP